MTTENRLEELAATLYRSMREGVDQNDPLLFRRLVVLLSDGRQSPQNALLRTSDGRVKTLWRYFANG